MKSARFLGRRSANGSGRREKGRLLSEADMLEDMLEGILEGGGSITPSGVALFVAFEGGLGCEDVACFWMPLSPRSSAIRGLASMLAGHVAGWPAERVLGGAWGW